MIGSLFRKLFGSKPKDDSPDGQAGAAAPMEETAKVAVGSVASPEAQPGGDPGSSASVAGARAPAFESDFESTVQPSADPAVRPVTNPPAEVAVAPETLCGIDPETMDRDAIRQHLAALYRRHNAAAASLNVELRAEAEQMLDAIVSCREKYIDPT